MSTLDDKESMILKEFQNTFHNQLDAIYGANEVDSFFYLLTKHYLHLNRLSLVYFRFKFESLVKFSTPILSTSTTFSGANVYPIQPPIINGSVTTRKSEKYLDKGVIIVQATLFSFSCVSGTDSSFSILIKY